MFVGSNHAWMEAYVEGDTLWIFLCCVQGVRNTMKEKMSINLHCGFCVLWERLSFNWFLCCRSFSLVKNSVNDNDN